MKRKLYLSCEDIEKGIYQESLSKRYALTYTSIYEAEVMCVPTNRNILTKQQAKDLAHAKELGIDVRIVDSSRLLDEHIKDVLNLKQKKKNIKREQSMHLRMEDEL